jgi:dTDP-4-amino-4,6-dideoxygalactose transaminase
MPENSAGRKLTAAKQAAAAIPIYRPRLPSAEALRPYLELLDRTRWYSNHGQLERQLAARLSRLFGSAEPITGTASSGTTALAGAILARAGRASAARPLCLCPGYTFVATAAAIEQCGYRLYIVDVDAASWSVDPAKLIANPELPRVGLAVPVAPYGRAVPQEPWRRFEKLTGVPVVIDGAAGLECLEDDPKAHIGPIPVALSFHATKVFATGEGGAIVTTDSALLLRSIQALNFGFMGARRSDIAGTNGKMSEYHAAVGLAALDGWFQKRADFAKIAGLYRECAARHGLGARLVTAPAIASCYTLYEAASLAEAQSVKAALSEDAIEHRHWYGLGLHREPSLAAAAGDPLPGVEALAPRLIGLPVAPDLTPAGIARIVAAIANATKKARA